MLGMKKMNSKKKKKKNDCVSTFTCKPFVNEEIIFYRHKFCICDTILPPNKLIVSVIYLFYSTESISGIMQLRIELNLTVAEVNNFFSLHLHFDESKLKIYTFIQNPAKLFYEVLN